MSSSPSVEKKVIPVKEGIFTSPLLPLGEVRLAGNKCRSCGAVMLGKRVGCKNCASRNLEDIIFSRKGKVYTFSIARYAPLPPFKAADPYVPFPVAWVELPEGIRILTALTDCDVEKVEIGMEVELVVDKIYEDKEGRGVIAYKFKPVPKEEC